MEKFKLFDINRAIQLTEQKQSVEQDEFFISRDIAIINSRIDEAILHSNDVCVINFDKLTSFHIPRRGDVVIDVLRKGGYDVRVVNGNLIIKWGGQPKQNASNSTNDEPIKTSFSLGEYNAILSLRYKINLDNVVGHMVFGDIIVDKLNRFAKGDYIHTSVVKSFEYINEDMIIAITNSGTRYLCVHAE